MLQCKNATEGPRLESSLLPTRELVARMSEAKSGVNRRNDRRFPGYRFAHPGYGVANDQLAAAAGMSRCRFMTILFSAPR